MTAQYNPETPAEACLHSSGWPDSWYFGVATALATLLGGLCPVWFGLRRWRQRTLIRDTPTEQAQSLSVGPSGAAGTAAPTPNGPMSAPFSSKDCVVVE